MSDLISRQAAIDRIESHIRTGDELYPLTDVEKTLNHAFEIAASCVYNLPSAQPERCEDCVNFSKTRLLIPQPEIIRCKECKHNPKHEWFGCPMSHLSEKQRPETAWCWKAERKTDE